LFVKIKYNVNIDKTEIIKPNAAAVTVSYAIGDPTITNKYKNWLVILKFNNGGVWVGFVQSQKNNISVKIQKIIQINNSIFFRPNLIIINVPIGKINSPVENEKEAINAVIVARRNPF
jgi:hypothetical protein